MQKKCSKCGETKNYNCFSSRGPASKGFYGQCKDCRRKYAKEKMGAWFKGYREKRKDWYSNYYKSYREENKDYYKLKKAEWKKGQQNNTEYQLTERMRKRIWKVMNGTGKSKATAELIGCSPVFLKNYIEGQFKEGMTWENYGEWHIDHIRPCSSFDLEDSKQQKECFNYTNLQPLWAEENLKKGATWPTD